MYDTPRGDKLAEDIVDLKVMVAGIAENQKAHQAQLSDLNNKMDTALIPIRFFKTTVAIVGGLSVLVGFLYGSVQLWHLVSGGSQG